MKRFLTMAVVGVLALGLSSTAYASICALDNVPASTLLFPYVVYDFEAGDVGNEGQTTLFAITNVSADAQIVHITVWTDYSIAILDFNLTLTGYDVQTINIRDILRDGILPSDDTGANEWWDGVVPGGPGDAGGTPFDDGPFSTFNQLWGGALDPWFAAVGLPDPSSTNPLDCNPAAWISSPVNYRAPLGNIPPGTLGIFRNYLTASQTATTGYRICDWSGAPVWQAGPWQPFPPPWFEEQPVRPTWLYVTADVVATCNKDLPDSDAVSYFGVGGVQTANVLIGDVIYLDSGNNFSEAFNAVHLEGAPGGTLGTTPTDSAFETGFYSRYHNANAPSMREPLPTAWGFRYMYTAASENQADTMIRAWKGSTNNGLIVDLDDTDTGPGGTISGPGPSTLYSNTCIPYTYYAWDEDENVNSVSAGFIPPWSGGEDPDPVPVPNLFPLETQEVPLSEFFVVEDAGGNKFGWMMVIWPRSNTTFGATVGYDIDQYQTWMGVKYAAFGNYTAGLEAAVLGNYNCNATDQLPRLAIGLYSE